MTPKPLLPAAFSSTQVLDCLADGILVTDVGDGSNGPKIVYANPAVCLITGYSADELLGQSPKMLHGRDTDPAVMRRLREDLDSGHFFNGQAINYRKDGTPFVMEWSISALVGEAGRPEYFVAVQRDVTLPARRLLDAEHAARTDPLTGLPNRSHLNDVLDGGGWLMASVRNGELVARWGGEEFCVLIVGSGERAASIAERIVSDIAAHPFSTSVGELGITASAGSAAIGGDCQTTKELLLAADSAMYAAKRLGRNRAVAAQQQLGVAS
jgi:PAS domain S-box-containing protein